MSRPLTTDLGNGSGVSGDFSLTYADVQAIAKLYGFDPKMMYSSVYCESNGIVLRNGRPVVAFNPQMFQRFTAMKVAGAPTWRKMEKEDIGRLGFLPRYPFQPALPKEVVLHKNDLNYRLVQGPWMRDSLARKGIYAYSIPDRMQIEFGMLDYLSHPLFREDAYRSLAIGPTQIMGFNHHVLGLASAEQMFAEFHHPDKALKMIGAFYSSYPGNINGVTVADCLRVANFDVFAILYAGDSTGAYAAKLRKVYKSL